MTATLICFVNMFRREVAAYFNPMATPWEKVEQHKVFVLNGQVTNDRRAKQPLSVNFALWHNFFLGVPSRNDNYFVVQREGVLLAAKPPTKSPPSERKPVIQSAAKNLNILYRAQ